MTNNTQKLKEKLIAEVLERLNKEDGERVKIELFNNTKKFVHDTLIESNLPTATSYCDAFAVGFMSSVGFWDRSNKDIEKFDKMIKYGTGSALWFVNIEKEAHQKKVDFLMENGGVVPPRSGRVAPKIIKKKEEEY